MLVLTRKVGERVLVGENITIEVLEVDGLRVKLGITAPREVPILREELQRYTDSLKEQPVTHGTTTGK